MQRNRKPCHSFLLINLARGMDCGRVPPMTTSTSCDMAVTYSYFDKVCPSKRKSVCDNTVLWVAADLHGASAIGKGKHEYTCLCCFLLSRWNPFSFDQATANLHHPKYLSTLSRTLNRFCRTMFHKTAVYSATNRPIKSCSLGLLRASLILDIQVMGSSHLSQSHTRLTCCNRELRFWAWLNLYIKLMPRNL